MVNAGELLGSNANRSPTAYEANPAEERARYAHDTDKLMTQLKLVDTDGRYATTTGVSVRTALDLVKAWSSIAGPS